LECGLAKTQSSSCGYGLVKRQLYCDVEQLLFHRVGGYDHTINGFPLAAVRSDRVPVIEVPIVRGKGPSILKPDSPVFDTPNSDQLSIRGAEIGVLAVAGKQEFVARGDLDPATLVDGEKTSLLCRYSFLFALWVSYRERTSLATNDFQSLVFLNTLDSAMKDDDLSVSVV
jgi:hypothetical protein